MKLSWILAAALVAGCSAQARQPAFQTSFQCGVALTVESAAAERSNLVALSDRLAPFTHWYGQETAKLAPSQRAEAQALLLTERFTSDAPYRKTVVNRCVHRAVANPGFTAAWRRFQQASERAAMRTASL